MRHRHSPSLSLPRRREAKLRQCDVVVQLLEDDLDAPPDLRLGIGRFQQVAGEQRSGRIVELDDDAGVGHRGGEALVAGVIHDGVGVDRSGAAYGFEFQVRRDALGTSRIGRVLEMSATLAALQFQNAALGRVPEGLRPLVWNGYRPGHLAPLAHWRDYPSFRFQGQPKQYSLGSSTGVSLRAQRSNLDGRSARGSRLLRRYAPRNDSRCVRI